MLWDENHLVTLRSCRLDDIFRPKDKLAIQHALPQSACQYSTATINHHGCHVVVHFTMLTDQLVMNFLVIVEDRDIAEATHLI
jgi:hypothetical protein